METYTSRLMATIITILLPLCFALCIWSRMSDINFYYFVDGIAMTFYFIMGLDNLNQRRNRLRIILGAILLFWAFECMMTAAFATDFFTNNHNISHMLNAMDMTAVPTCCFLLLELCIPGWLTWRKVVIHEIPFVCLGLLSVFGDMVFYYTLIVFSVLYGIGVAILVLINIPRYNKKLKEYYSYEENVNLRWLYYVLLTFFVLLLFYASCSASDLIAKIAHRVPLISLFWYHLKLCFKIPYHFLGTAHPII